LTGPLTNWFVAQLKDLTSKVGSGATPRGGGESYKNTGTPLIRSMNVVMFGFKREGLAYIDEDQSKALNNVEVQGGDVLLNITGASIGRVTLAPADLGGARVNQHVCIIRPTAGLDARYLAAYLSSPEMQAEIGADHYGMTRPALTKQQILEFEIPIPPHPEQIRIADKIDALVGQIRDCRERLRRIPQILKKFREAVLEAAVSGKLTEQWRVTADAGDIENELSHIDAVRMNSWRNHNRGAAKKSVEPLKPFLDKIPPNWRWVSLDRLALLVVDGTHFTPTYVAHGIPFVSVKDIRSERIHLDNCKYISVGEHRELAKRCHPEKGDLLVTKSGTIGRVALVGDEGEFSLFVSVALVKPVPDLVLTSYLSIAFRAWLNSIDIASEITGTGIKNLHLRDLRKVPIALPPIYEQREIIRRVAEFTERDERLTRRSNQVSSFVEMLTPSTLAKAFRGELVPQDPNDEPAGHVLEKTRRQSAANVHLSARSNDKINFPKMRRARATR
jgi:type I restriction enzyme S subunit